MDLVYLQELNRLKREIASLQLQISILKANNHFVLEDLKEFRPATALDYTLLKDNILFTKP